MEQPGTVIVLDRPRVRAEHAGPAVQPGGTATPPIREQTARPAPAPVPVVPPVGIGSLLRGPGLALLAALSLVEGYRWLGVFPGGSTGGGSPAFGTIGVGVVAVLTPVLAAVLTSRREPGQPIRLAGVVVAVALAVTVVTGAALVTGGHAWREAAGVTDIVLAAVAFAAVAIGEHTRNRPPAVGGGRRARGGQAIDGVS
jgi:hypothetical protein